MQLKTGLQLFRWIRYSIAALVLGVIALLAINVNQVVDRVDTSSHDRDIAALQSGLFMLGEVTSAEQVGVTVWDEAYDNVVVDRNPSWMEANLGHGVFDGNEERVVVVDGEGGVVFSSRSTDAASLQAEEDTVTAASVIIDRVRSLHRQALYRVGDGWGIHLERPRAMVPGIYAHDIAVVDGMPAIVTVSAFLPDVDAERLSNAAPAVLVHIRYLKGDTLTDLMATSRLENIRLEFATDPSTGDEPGRHDLLDLAGNPVTTAYWDREAPGKAVFRAMLPTLLLTVLLITVFVTGGSNVVKRIVEGLARREADAVHQSRHDPMTGLANRSWFHASLAEAVSHLDGGDSGVGVALIDLDYFKSVNDTLGHAAGDAVIKAAAERMQSLSGECVVAARLGGDEFAVVTRALADASALDAFCARLHDLLVGSVSWEGHVIPVSASVGAAVCSVGPNDVDTALLAADLALYRAKRDGRGCFRIYDVARDGLPGESDAKVELSDARQNAVGPEGEGTRAAA